LTKEIFLVVCVWMVNSIWMAKKGHKRRNWLNKITSTQVRQILMGLIKIGLANALFTPQIK
jgi:threonine/homoserine/homoserine lactone efflux protein